MGGSSPIGTFCTPQLSRVRSVGPKTQRPSGLPAGPERNRDPPVGGGVAAAAMHDPVVEQHSVTRFDREAGHVVTVGMLLEGNDLLVEAHHMIAETVPDPVDVLAGHRRIEVGPVGLTP